MLAVSPWFASAASAQSAETVVGVNVINPCALGDAEQDAMLDAIHAAGPSVIRASITLNDEGVDFAEKAWKHGVKIEWLIYRFGGYEPFGKVPLSASDHEQFRKDFQPVLDRLEAKGTLLAGFELGNEINLSGTNPEFTQTGGPARQLSLADLVRDPEGRRIAAEYLRYLRVLAVLKDMRDRSTLNQDTPLMTAGLGTYDQGDGPLPAWAKGDTVGINTTLQFMRLHGLDALVDAYAVHIYPDSKHQSPEASVARKERIDEYDLAACRPQGSSDGKRCWITEWGIDNGDLRCPIDDTSRARTVREVMTDFRPYVRRGSVARLMYFAWNSTPNARAILASSLWRCGALSKAGTSALNVNLLK